MRLIDADALLEQMKVRLPMEDDITEGVSNCAKIARRLVAKAPTVDAVKHGRWIEETTFCCSCSICNHTRGGTAYEDCQNYCPNCGARMDGAEDGRESL